MQNRLTIYFTSDIHGYLYPTNYADPAPRPQGLLSMAFAKDGNTLIIDGGDILQGSALTYYCNARGIPMPLATAMNRMGYDYVTLGNHDFNYGYETLREHLQTLDAKCLCANVSDTTRQLPVGNWAIHSLHNGLRVGLFGIVTDWIRRWEKPENLTKINITDPYTAASEAVAALRGQVDILVGIYHGGLEKDLSTQKALSKTDENIACRLCEDFPIDILLTGHQHIALANQTYCGTHVVQTPCYGTQYVKLVMDSQGGISSQLCNPTRLPQSHKWQDDLYNEISDWLDRPIGRLSKAIWPKDKLTMALQGSSIAWFFNHVQLVASGAQISCTSLGNELRGFDSSVTVRDVVSSYIYSNTLVVLRVTGQMLRMALELCAGYFAVEPDGGLQISQHFLRPKEAHYNYDYFDGIIYTFDLRMPVGQRVTEILYQGNAIENEAHYTLVMNNYRASGAGDFDFFADCERVSEIQIEVSELILDYLSKNDIVYVPDETSFQVLLPDGQQA